MGHHAEPSLRFEKIDGKVAIGVKPVQLEPAVRRLAVVGTHPRAPRCRAGGSAARPMIQASWTGRPSGPTMRPATVKPRRRTMRTSRPGPLRLGSQAMNQLEYARLAAGRAKGDLKNADHAQNVIVARGVDRQMTGAGYHCELERSIG